MTLQEFNPSWYFRSRLSDEDIQKVKNIFVSFIDDDNNFHNPPQWGANVKSSFYHPNNDNPKWDSFLEILKPFTDEFISIMKPKMPVEVFAQEGWVNKYSWQYFQEYHTHASPDINLSMIYFYKVKKDDECFKFVTDHSLYSSNGYNKMFQQDGGSQFHSNLGLLSTRDLSLAMVEVLHHFNQQLYILAKI